MILGGLVRFRGLGMKCCKPRLDIDSPCIFQALPAVLHVTGVGRGILANPQRATPDFSDAIVRLRPASRAHDKVVELVAQLADGLRNVLGDIEHEIRDFLGPRGMVEQGVLARAVSSRSDDGLVRSVGVESDHDIGILVAGPGFAKV